MLLITNRTPHLFALLVLLALASSCNRNLQQTYTTNAERDWHLKQWIDLPTKTTPKGDTFQSFKLPTGKHVYLRTAKDRTSQSLSFEDSDSNYPYLQYKVKGSSFTIWQGFPNLNLMIFPANKDELGGPRIIYIIENVTCTFQVALRELPDHTFAFIHIVSDPGYDEPGYQGKPLGHW